MTFAISQIAWNPEEDEQVFSTLRKNHITQIELAPTRVFTDVEHATAQMARQYRGQLLDHGLTPVAMQSLLFGRHDLQIFQGAEQRKATLEYLRKIVGLAAELGAKRLVFGSPKNRYVPSGNVQDVQATAQDFFWQIAESCQSHDVFFCLEPNAPQYGCNFLTNTQDTVAFVAALAHPHLQVHLDSAVLALNHEDIHQAYALAQPYLCHMHVSEPFLELIGSHPETPHVLIAHELQAQHYEHAVSIEMKSGVLPDNIAAIQQAITFLQHTYLHHDN